MKPMALALTLFLSSYAFANDMKKMSCDFSIITTSQNGDYIEETKFNFDSDVIKDSEQDFTFETDDLYRLIDDEGFANKTYNSLANYSLFTTIASSLISDQVVDEIKNNLLRVNMKMFHKSDSLRNNFANSIHTDFLMVKTKKEQKYEVPTFEYLPFDGSLGETKNSAQSYIKSVRKMSGNISSQYLGYDEFKNVGKEIIQLIKDGKVDKSTVVGLTLRSCKIERFSTN